MPFPWPSRRARQEAVAAARREKARSQAGAAHAARIERDIRRMHDDNHFAAAIADQIIQRHARGEEGT